MKLTKFKSGRVSIVGTLRTMDIGDSWDLPYYITVESARVLVKCVKEFRFKVSCKKETGYNVIITRIY